MLRRFWNWLRSFRASPVGPRNFTVGPDVADQPLGPQPKIKQNPSQSGRQRPRRSTYRRRAGGWSGAIAMRGRAS